MEGSLEDVEADELLHVGHETTDIIINNNNNNNDDEGHDGILPAKPITGDMALWLPRIATAGCLGLTYVRARQHVGLTGTSALAFPLFGTNAKERLFALYMAGNLTSPLMIWTLEELGRQSASGFGGWGLFGPDVVSLTATLLLANALQRLGFDHTAPFYFLEALVPLRDEHQGTPARKIDPDVAQAVLPATLLAHVVPTLLMGVLPMTFTDVSRAPYGLQSLVCHAFLYSPFTVPALTYGLVSLRKWTRYRANLRASPGQRRLYSHELIDDDDDDNNNNNINDGNYYTVGGRRSIAGLKNAYTDLVSVQAAGHVLAVATLGIQAWRMWEKLAAAVPGASLVAKAQATLQWVLRPMDFTRFELLGLYVAATTSMGLYTVWDLRRRGYATTRAAGTAAAGLVLGQVLVGPGASYAGLWMWREGVLAGLPPGV